MPNQGNFEDVYTTTINAIYPITPYQPTEWKTGDIVSSQRLNKIENNIGPLIVNLIVNDDMENERIDASFNDIKTAILAGRPVYMMTAKNITDSDGTGFAAEMIPFGSMRDFDGHQFVANFYGGGIIQVFATDPDEPMSFNEPTQGQ